MELDLIFKVLRRRLWIIILVPCIAAIAGYLFSLRTEKKYNSEAVLATGFTTNERVQIVDERVDLWAAGVKFDNMIERMRSELTMSLLTYKLVLHDLTESKPFRTLGAEADKSLLSTAEERANVISLLKKKLENMEQLSEYDAYEKRVIKLTEDLGYAGWMLNPGININREGSTDFVRVSFSSEDPFLSAFVVNTVSEQFIRYDSSLKSGVSEESVKFFADLVTEKKKILDEKTSYLDRYKSSNSLLGEDFADLKSAQLVDYELLRQEKRDDIRSRELSLKDVNNQIAVLDRNSTESPATINSKIIEIRSKINELNQIYASAGSKDAALLANINKLRDDYQIEMNKLAASSGGGSKLSRNELEIKKQGLVLELEILNAGLLSLDQTIAGLKNSVSGSVSTKSTVESLQREAETASDEYLQAVDKYNSERNKSLLANSSITLTQPGRPNGSPESSKTLLIVGLSFMASLSLCVFVIVSLEFIDQRIKNPSRFESFTDLNLLGWLNTINVNNLDLRMLFKANTSNESLERFKQFLRKIRFEVESSKSQVLLVTSTKKGEGKTFVILSLAYSMSLLNKRALIIDTNFRNNSLTKLLLTKTSTQKTLPGTSNARLLSIPEGTSHEESSTFISKTSDKNIDIIGNTPGVDSPSEILAGRDFTSMISRLRESYDYILMEGACLNDFSDTKELMDYADKVITVFSAESTISQLDKESITFIKNLNGAFMGAILNKVDEKNVA